MLEKVLGVTRVQRVNHYDDSRQSPKDTFKKKQQLGFQNILNQKMSEKSPAGSDPYYVNISRR